MNEYWNINVTIQIKDDLNLEQGLVHCLDLMDLDKEQHQSSFQIATLKAIDVDDGFWRREDEREGESVVTKKIIIKLIYFTKSTSHIILPLANHYLKHFLKI